MSMPVAPSQLLGKGVPYVTCFAFLEIGLTLCSSRFEAQFGHVPRRKQKGGFFSFGSSDTSDSDLGVFHFTMVRHLELTNVLI